MTDSNATSYTRPHTQLAAAIIRAETAEAKAASWKAQSRKHEDRLKHYKLDHLGQHETKYEALLRDIARHVVTELQSAKYLQINPEGLDTN